MKEVEQKQYECYSKWIRSESIVNTLNMRRIAKGIRRQEQTFANTTSSYEKNQWNNLSEQTRAAGSQKAFLNQTELRK